MNIKIDIISGFLGAGKTTLIKKILESNLKKEKLAIIENEFGEVSIDGDLLKDTNIDMKEINSGCICCSLVGDFKEAIKEIIKKYSPERIIIEPSGVAKLSDIIKSCKSIAINNNISINNVFTVIDSINYESYINNFGEFYKDQIKNAKTIILSKRENDSEAQIEQISKSIRNINKDSSIITAPLDEMDGNDILVIAEEDSKRENEKNISIKKSFGVGKVNKVSHSHSANNIFNNWGIETEKAFSKSTLEEIFETIVRDKSYGKILRGKGIVQLEGGNWGEFHYTPGRFNLSSTTSQKVGKIVIIGEDVNKNKLNKLFKVNR
ncbi:GTP-binding protein [Clostridium sp. SHJSY1]|uniref:CobW family GTP-binding protein n=1 Tax=Clostridium sp. SHJSY1 TaxID=2942483 RepID=UPI00287407DE|nr:GTP-binding protein [Clostridium sp. SHJSY1]MDS0524666.1 GTP-binding protein [Clostridium sp. SHJSY1]